MGYAHAEATGREEERAGRDAGDDIEVEEQDQGLSQDEAEEGREPRRLPAPQRVSDKEKEDHYATHTPYRSWCSYCVRGRGKKMAHRRGDREDKPADVPRACMDYFYMSTGDEEVGANPIFVMVDEGSGEKYARAAGSKGVGDQGEHDWLIKDACAELRAWGHPGGGENRLILKSDGEASIVALRSALAKFHGGQVVPETSAKGESQSNGVVEEAGKTIREFVRVLKEQMEDRAGMTLSPGDVIVQWMVRWAAMLCSRFLVGKDGCTAFERRRGRKCQIPVVPFGESVWYKEIRMHKERREKFSSEDQEGIWLGHNRSSNEVLIGTPNGVVRAYSVTRREPEARWNADAIRNMKGTPQQPDPNKPSMNIPIRIQFDQAANAEPEPTVPPRKERAPRRMRLTEALFQKYGYTDGCEGCTFRRANLGDHRAHSERCRTRMEEAVDADEELRYRREEEQARFDRYASAATQQSPGAAPATDAGGGERSMATAAGAADTSSGGHAGNGNGHSPVASSSGNAGNSNGHGPVRADADAQNISNHSVISNQAAEEDVRMDNFENGNTNNGSTTSNDTEMMDLLQGTIRRLEVESELEEMIKRVSVDVAEVYSPPRVTTHAAKMGLAPGEAMDLTTGWDFTLERHRQAALKYIQKVKPKLLIGSPECTMFSALQICNRKNWGPEKQARWIEAREHIRFVVTLYAEQLRNGRWFVHEHPHTASSWDLEEIQQLSQKMGVHIAVADQCMYGLTTWNRAGVPGAAARKRTRFLTNSSYIAEELSQKCDGSHAHQSLEGGRARQAAIYPEKLCQAICRGLIREQQAQSFQLRCLMVIQHDADMAKSKADEHEGEDFIGEAWDDITGEVLDGKEVRKARMKEIGYIHQKGVWKTIPREQAEEEGIQILKTRWIDTNKGDAKLPVHRSRFVAKEFNQSREMGLFASTPPLEALKLLVSDAATKGPNGQRKVVMINDVARAFFEAPVNRKICVELPDECKEGMEGDMVGLLQRSLYGTRDAAANFQVEVRKFMQQLGFRVGRYNASTFYHVGRQLRTLVHGDDFVTVGDKQGVDWLRRELEHRFEIKTAMIGHGHHENREGRILNRVLRATESGWEYEADQRHSDLLIKALNLQEANPVVTPGEDEKKDTEAQNEVPLVGEKATEYRALAARANYLALDRADIQYMAKELCRSMSQPTVGGQKAIKKICPVFNR